MNARLVLKDVAGKEVLKLRVDWPAGTREFSLLGLLKGIPGANQAHRVEADLSVVLDVPVKYIPLTILPTGCGSCTRWCPRTGGTGFCMNDPSQTTIWEGRQPCDKFIRRP